MSKCEPGCTCNRHNRVISDEHRQNIAQANAARKGESHPCPEGCTCGKHKAAYRGGSKKCPPDCTCSKHTATSRLPVEKKGGKCPPGCTCGRHSAETRRAISEARTGTTHTEEHKAKIGEASRRVWAEKTPEEMAEISRKRSESAQQQWAKEKSEGYRRMSEAAKKRWAENRQPVSEETRKKQSEAAKLRWENNPRPADSEETSKKRSEAAKRRWEEERQKRQKTPSYKQTPEHVAARNKKCPPGCTCKKHTSWQTGVEAAKAGTARAKEAGVYKESSRKGQATRANWSDEKRDEVSRNMSEAKRLEWAEKGPDRNGVPSFFSGWTSQEERSLIPYLEKYGFQHNDPEGDHRTHIGRRVPDFVNFTDRKLFEFFGHFRHEPEDEEERIDYYRSKGWDCVILWEVDLPDWLREHEHLVTAEEHQHAWRAMRKNRKSVLKGLGLPPDPLSD